MLKRTSSALALTILAALPFAWSSLQAQKGAQAPTAAPVDFARDIQPILQSHCYECHGPEKARGRLRLDRRSGALKGGETGPALVAGDSDHSLIVRRILGLDDEERMPKEGDPLAAGQIAMIRAWIDQGAAWPETAETAESSQESRPEANHWAYRAPEQPAVPEVKRSDWARTPIDRFALARLEKDALPPSPEAPLETLVRRVSLDLIGLPPSPEEVDAVIAEAKTNGRDVAYQRLVDRLLASPHYGERWARPWLDLARYADSHGFEKDLPRVMWKYRDWVIDALNRDMPFDRFTVEQIAGDMLKDATVEQQIASGFHRNAMTNEEGGIDPEEAHYEVMVDRVNTTSTVWLGSTLGCAQCHDHKYDPFSQKDYYRMMAFFTNTAYEVRKLGDGTKFTETMIDVPTSEQEASRKTIQAEIDRVNQELKADSAVVDRSQVLWEQTMRAEPALRWQVLTPKTLDGAGGAVLTASADGSILVSGANPGYVSYTLEATAALPRITAVRLEALPDPSLPKGGPGRDIYGNFQLNGIEAAQVTNGIASPLTFTSIKSDDGGASMDSFFPKSLSRDAYAPRGWRIDASREDPRLPRQVVFVLDKPLVAAGPTRLRVRLLHQSTAVGQAIGRFRVSVTSSRSPQRIVELPARLRPVLMIDASARTEQQRKDLAAFYRTVAAPLKPARERLASLQKELRSLGIPTALVMRERPGYERPSAFVRRRGSFLDKGEQVFADVPDILRSLADDQMPNRLGLAHWLVDEANPLTARVAVNRAWEQFFGRGIVETSEDFGTQGAEPSHPRAPRLARHGIRETGLADEAASQADGNVSGLPAIVGCAAGARRPRSVQPAPRARATVQAGSGDGPRRRARCERPVEPQDRRAERVPAATGRHLGHPLQQREVDAQRGGRSISARHLYVHPTIRRVSQLHDVRCHEPRVLHRPPRAHEYAAPGSHHHERRRVFRGGESARGAGAGRVARSGSRERFGSGRGAKVPRYQGIPSRRDTDADGRGTPTNR